MGCPYLAWLSKAGFLSVPFPEFSFPSPFSIPYRFPEPCPWRLLSDVRYLNLELIFYECFVVVDLKFPGGEKTNPKAVFAFQIREKKKTSFFFSPISSNLTSSLGCHAGSGGVPIHEVFKNLEDVI